MAIWSAEIKELEILYESFKGHFPELEKELGQLISTDDPNVIMLYSRRCLEVIITDICECELKRPRKTEPLKGILDKLHKEEKVPSHIISSMHGLNELSTYGAHPKDFDPEQVKPVLINLYITIKWYLKYKELQISGMVVQEPQIHVEKLPEVNAEAVIKPKRNIILVLAGIILIAVVFTIPKIFKRDKFEEIRDPDGKISVAVMPFDNLTGDTTLNWFGKGISSLIINGLGSSKELAVCDDHTMFEAMEGMNNVYSAGISPTVAKEVANKVKAESYISGSFQGRENIYWILVNLVNTQNGNIIWTNRVTGNLKSSGYLDVADSLCYEIKNYLEIQALENIADFDFREAYPKSSEAYRYFIEGMNSVLNQNYKFGIQSLKRALEIDSTFTLATFYLAYAYCFWYQPEQIILWTNKAYQHKERVPPKYQLWIELWYAVHNGKDMQGITRYCDQLAESGINTRYLWNDLGLTYCVDLHQYEKAVSSFEKVLEINPERIGDWKFIIFWDSFISALHKTGNHEREREISETGLKVLPDNSNWFFCRMAVCALSQGKTNEADEFLLRYRAKHKELGTQENLLELFLGQLYEEANFMDQAEMHYRKSCELNPQNADCILDLARFLINNEINVDEGMGLIQKILEKKPDHESALQLKGWGLYKRNNYEEALQLLGKMWEISKGFNIELYNHLEAAKKAVAGLQKRTD